MKHTEILIEAKGITKSYWQGEIETPVLKGIDLTIPEGAEIVITGASGTGKSTLLHLLASLDPPSAGTVFFRGRDLYRQSDPSLSELRNLEIGFVFQFHHLLPELNALENVMLPLFIRGGPRREMKERAREILTELGLGPRLTHRPSALSGGEQQRVAVARAIAGSPSLLFADEPTGNLDRASGDQLIEALLKLHQQKGMALVLVTHNEQMIHNFRSKYLMADGRIFSRA
ncbi:MAG: ABC transporter ATP-binding protein [Deltaproteobacteria bacterium]|nr:ABC transporter ATP-binding protein [Deltaproteobacteria bacterium]